MVQKTIKQMLLLLMVIRGVTMTSSDLHSAGNNNNVYVRQEGYKVLVKKISRMLSSQAESRASA